MGIIVGCNKTYVQCDKTGCKTVPTVVMTNTKYERMLKKKVGGFPVLMASHFVQDAVVGNNENLQKPKRNQTALFPRYIRKGTMG